MLIIFDVDGTLIGGEAFDWKCFNDAFASASGIAIKQFPHATSSDARRRADIIRLAAQRANRPLSESIYVGDGPWDLNACRELNIPFIGTGSRVKALVEAGAQWTLPTLHTEPFLEIINQIQLHKQIRQNGRDDQNFNESHNAHYGEQYRPRFQSLLLGKAA